MAKEFIYDIWNIRLNSRLGKQNLSVQATPPPLQKQLLHPSVEGKLSPLL